jgi:hypothetical protein
MQNPQISQENDRSLLATSSKQNSENHGFAGLFEKRWGSQVKECAD